MFYADAAAVLRDSGLMIDPFYDVICKVRHWSRPYSHPSNVGWTDG
jgi:hypothetical protein